MDILIYVTVTLIFGLVSCYKNGNMNFNEMTVEEIQADVGDDMLGDVTRAEIPVGNNLEGHYEEGAFMKIIKELGLG